MVISEIRIAADCGNDGPPIETETPEDPGRSRAEALHRGLCDSPVVPEDLERVQGRSLDWYRALKPRNELHAWLVDQVAVISIRVDRCGRIERRLRDRHSLRAEIAWDLDRRHEAEVIGSRIARRPGEVVAALQRSPHGCDWLMTRWALLAQAADSQGRWTAEQASMAFDLLGTPAEFRQGRDPGVAPDLEGRVVEPDQGPAAVARREIAALRELRQALAGLDEVDRSLAEADLLDETNHELKKLRRYEAALHRRIRWCFEQLKYESPHKGPSPEIKSRWVARDEPQVAAEPAPAPEPAPEGEARTLMNPHPPFDLEPEECPEPGVEVDIPAILASRRKRRAMKAEARREARRGKLERLRA